MNTNRKSHALAITAVLIFTCYIALPSATAGKLDGTNWTITGGDTLYAIGRAIYPGDVRKQARLRQDIVALNPSVFAGGSNNMKVGSVLKLPGYVTEKSESRSKVSTTSSAPKKVPSKTASRPTTSTAGVSKSSGSTWKVIDGDTLFLICRSIYPDNARQQAQLGRDIRNLNSGIFANGADGMRAGVILKLPSYVPTQNIPASRISVEKKESVDVSRPITLKTTPAVSDLHAPNVSAEVAPEPKIKPEASAQLTEPRGKRPVTRSRSGSTAVRSGSKSGAIVSVGYSNGGDKLVNVNNGADIFAGTGFHLRIGYEQMFQQNRGYQVALGYQYYSLASGGTSYRDTYLQLAYQHQINPFVFGVGAVIDGGARLKDNNNAYKFDPAVGGTVYMEYLGASLKHGLGLSATLFNIKEKSTGTTFNANRGEIYYRWRF